MTNSFFFSLSFTRARIHHSEKSIVEFRFSLFYKCGGLSVCTHAMPATTTVTASERLPTPQNIQNSLIHTHPLYAYTPTQSATTSHTTHIRITYKIVLYQTQAASYFLHGLIHIGFFLILVDTHRDSIYFMLY